MTLANIPRETEPADAAKAVLLKLKEPLLSKVVKHHENLRKSFGSAGVPFLQAVFHLIQIGIDAEYPVEAD